MKTDANQQVLKASVPPTGVALRRVIEEIATPDVVAMSGYNRTYNRHNR